MLRTFLVGEIQYQIWRYLHVIKLIRAKQNPAHVVYHVFLRLVLHGEMGVCHTRGRIVLIPGKEHIPFRIQNDDIVGGLVSEPGRYRARQICRALLRKFILQLQVDGSARLLFLRNQRAVILGNIQRHPRALDRREHGKHVVFQLSLQIVYIFLLLVGLRRGKTAVRHVTDPVACCLNIIGAKKQIRLPELFIQDGYIQSVVRYLIIITLGFQKVCHFRGFLSRRTLPEQYILRSGETCHDNHKGNNEYRYH